MLIYNPKIHRCEHIKVNGTQCGSPAIRHNRFCYFHGRWHEQYITFAETAKTVPAIDLPVLEDANSIQVAIMQVIGLLLTGHIEHKSAGLILYGLQTASGNLRHANFEAYPPSVVIDPATVDETLLGEYVWENSDFDGEEKEEDKNDSSETNIGDAVLLQDSAEKDTTKKDSVEANRESKSQPQENDWTELRAQIARMVKKSALEGVFAMTRDTG